MENEYFCMKYEVGLHISVLDLCLDLGRGCEFLHALGHGVQAIFGSIKGMDSSIVMRVEESRQVLCFVARSCTGIDKLSFGALLLVAYDAIREKI